MRVNRDSVIKLLFYVVLVTDELDMKKPRTNYSRGENCWGEMLFYSANGPVTEHIKNVNPVVHDTTVKRLIT